MAKLSREEIKNHEKCIKLLNKDILTYDDKIFIYDNWNEGADSMNSKFGAFFTPRGLAQDFNLEVFTGKNIKIIDLCAGIGMLSFINYHFSDEKPQITCVELNSDYLEVGKKLLPEANWVLGSVLDKELIFSLGKFDQTISNPPFGKIKHVDDSSWLNYKGSEFEYKVMDIASKISDYGTFIVPQNSTPFRYSGDQCFKDLLKDDNIDSLPQKLKNFIKSTNFKFQFNLGIDTSFYLKEWKGVSPMCEIVSIDYSEYCR